MTTTQHPIVQSYLRRLEAALLNAPADERQQIRDGIEEHVAAALGDLDYPTEADVRNVLTRLGDPEAIAAAACDDAGRERHTRSVLTKALLSVGAIVGIFDLLMVSTSRIGPIEFAFLAVPVVILCVLAAGFHRRALA